MRPFGMANRMTTTNCALRYTCYTPKGVCNTCNGVTTCTGRYIVTDVTHVTVVLNP